VCVPGGEGGVIGGPWNPLCSTQLRTQRLLLPHSVQKLPLCRTRPLQETRQQMMNDVKALCDAPNVPGLINFYGAYHVPDSGQVWQQGRSVYQGCWWLPIINHKGWWRRYCRTQKGLCFCLGCNPTASDFNCAGVHGRGIPGGCAAQGRQGREWRAVGRACSPLGPFQLALRRAGSPHV
jgi:hypothetical protein